MPEAARTLGAGSGDFLEDEHGGTIFELTEPSSFFGQYGDERVTEVERYLDATLEAVLLYAAE
jgi:hypothetical protein